MIRRIGRGLYHGVVGLALLAISTMFLDRGGVLNLDDLLQVGRHAQLARASQGSCVMPTTGTVSGLTLVVGINSCFAAILTSNSGVTAPANGAGGVPQTGQVWMDTSGTLPAIKLFDGTSWVTLGSIDNGNHIWAPVVGGAADTVASATTTDLWSVKPASVSVTGTGTITALASASAAVGTVKVVRFTGAATLTHNATSLILPGGANITTASGDSAIVLALTTTNVAVVSYTRATGQAVVNPSVPIGTILHTAAILVPDANYLMSYGQTVSRATYATLLGLVTTAQTGTRTNGSPIVTALSDTTQLHAGTAVEGTGFTSGTLILTVDSATQVTLTNNAGSSGSATLTFFPYGAGNGSTTFQMPDCRGVIIAGPDNLGGTARGALTVTTMGLQGARPGATGGAQTNAIAQGHLPSGITLNPTTPTQALGHTSGAGSAITPNGGSAGTTVVNPGATTIYNSGTYAAIADHTVTFPTVSLGGSGTAFPVVQPTMVMNCMMRVL